MIAVRAVEFGFALSQRFVQRKRLLAYFTTQLRTFLTIVEIDILIRGVAMRARYLFGNVGFLRLAINRLKGFVVLLLIFLENYLVVFLFFCFRRFFLLSGN